MYQRDDAKDPHIRCHVFVTNDFKGEVKETEEMRPEWFSKELIPWHEMWESDKDWVQEVLEGKSVSLKLYFGEHQKFLYSEPLNLTD